MCSAEHPILVQRKDLSLRIVMSERKGRRCRRRLESVQVYLLVKLPYFLHLSIDYFHILHACVSHVDPHLNGLCVKVNVIFQGQRSNIHIIGQITYFHMGQLLLDQ